MAEDPRFLLHFKTLAKFKEKLADGTVSENKHLVFIKDEKLVWCRGIYYADASKLDNFNSYYNDWSITLTSATAITITLKGNLWNATTRKWEAISKPLTLLPASSTIAGLMIALDKRLLDIIDTANFLLSAPTTNATQVVINASHTDVNNETRNLKTSQTLTSATSTNAGILIAQDKRQLDIIDSANFELTAPTTTATNVILHTKRTNVNDEARNIADSETAAARTLPAATLTMAGVMIALDKLKEDRITGVNYTISNPESTSSSRVLRITGLNPNNNTTITSDVTLPASTQSLAGLMNTTDKLAIDNIIKLGSFSHMNDEALFTRTASDVSINYKCKSVGATSTAEPTSHSIPIGAATQSLAGVMIASDKTKLDRITTTDFTLGTPTTTATSVTINATKKTPSTNVTSSNNINIPLATRTTAGVITSTEKLYLDAIKTLTALTHVKHSDAGGITTDTANVYLNFNCVGLSDLAVIARLLTIPTATTTTAGVITNREKKILNNITFADAGTAVTEGISKINFSAGSTDTALILTENTSDSTKFIVELNDNFGNLDTNNADLFLVRGSLSNSTDPSLAVTAANNVRFQVGKTIQARSKNNVLERVLTTIDLSDGSVTRVGTATVGSGIKPIYLNAGTPTASSSTVGNTLRPVYLNAGTLTLCLTPATGAWFQGIPLVSTNGVSEMGRYIDFHPTTDSTLDYNVRLDAGTSTSARTFTFGSALGELVTHTAGTAIGSGIIPTYVAASGAVTASTSTVGAANKPIYMNAGTITACSSTVGSTTKPVYMNAGTITESNATVGSTSKPVYLNAGTVTALSTTIGSATRPVYINAGTITAGTYTFGNASGNAPISNGTVNTNLNADMVDGLHSTAFARADQSAEVDLDTVNGRGIMTNSANANATTARHYPIAEAGTLFYGTAAYSSANQIYGTFNTNRWFVRGGGSSTTTKTEWKELLHTGNYSTTLDTRYYTESEIDTKVNTINSTISTNKTTMDNHIANKSNPHAVTAAQVGLGNVTNESKATMFTSPAFTGTPTAPTAGATTSTTLVATTAFVQSAIENKLAANDAMLYKGTVTANSQLPATHNAGWTYKVAAAGTYAGKVCEVGDMIICNTDSTTANDAHWDVILANINGAVTGPASAVSGRIATFNGTTGKVIADSGYTIATSVPSGAKFTDTTYSAGTGLSLSGTTFNHSNSITAVTAYQGTATAASGTAGAVTVISGVKYDALGHVTGVLSKSITLANTTYSAATSSAAGLMPAADKAWLDLANNDNGIVTNIDSSPNILTTGLLYFYYVARRGNTLTNQYSFTITNATSTQPGLMSTADKAKLDGISSGANNYSLPLAANGTRGGVLIGYTTSGKNYAVLLSGEKMYVNVPWTDTTYSAASTSAAGLMSAADKSKLDGISAGANNYSLPLATSTTRGGVKIGYTANGKNYPVLLSNELMYVNVPWTDTNTTYSAATTSSAGLMSAADKSKLDGIASGANNYTLPSTVAHIDKALTWKAYQDFTAGAGNSGSDMRYKENVKPLESVLDNILDLDIISYIWNKNGEATRDTFGVSADQLLEKGSIYSKMVHERMDKEKTKWVEYERFGVLAIKAILELSEKLDVERKRNNELELRILKLEYNV